MSQPTNPTTTMSSTRPASTVGFGSYLDRMYDAKMQEAEQAYATHIQAVKELHHAQVQMMRAEQAIRTLRTMSLPKRLLMQPRRLSWLIRSARQLARF